MRRGGVYALAHEHAARWRGFVQAVRRFLRGGAVFRRRAIALFASRNACSGRCARAREGRMAFARGEQLLFGHEIKMFAPEHLYSFGEQSLFAAEMLLLTQEMLHLRRKKLLPGHEQLYLCTVHRLSQCGIFHS
jgi:hypothetical protein